MRLGRGISCIHIFLSCWGCSDEALSLSNGAPEPALQMSAPFFHACLRRRRYSACPKVSALPAAERGSDPFAPTHWSVIVAASAGESEPENARAALGALCQTYWAPLYGFVRSRGYSTHDAQDLTQSFFAYLLEHQIYARADPGKGRFRSFLLAALKNFMADAYAHDHALKRGGADAFLPLEEGRAAAAESLFQTHAGSAEPSHEDQLFEQTWAETLVQKSLAQLSADYAAEGKQSLFQHLRVFVAGSPDPLPAYEQLAAAVGIPASSLRTYVTRLRAHYREILRSHVRETVANDGEIDGELHELFRVLSGGD